MNALFATAVAAACLAAASFVQAAEQATLTVTGTLQPGSCTVSFTNPTLDYGMLRAADLSASAATHLPAKSVAYSLVCESDMAVSTSWIDDRQGTAYGTRPEHFGLGKVSEQPIGDYQLVHDEGNTSADGSAVKLLVSEDGISWQPGSAAAFTVTPGGGQQFSYTGHGGTKPQAFAQYAGQLTVNARIAPTQTLDMSGVINLDGAATLSVHYL